MPKQKRAEQFIRSVSSLKPWEIDKAGCHIPAVTKATTRNSILETRPVERYALLSARSKQTSWEAAVLDSETTSGLFDNNSQGPPFEIQRRSGEKEKCHAFVQQDFQLCQDLRFGDVTSLDFVCGAASFGSVHSTCLYNREFGRKPSTDGDAPLNGSGADNSAIAGSVCVPQRNSRHHLGLRRATPPGMDECGYANRGGSKARLYGNLGR